MSLICSNRECSPLQPLTGQKLIRKYYKDYSTGKCPNCKRIYNIEVMTDGRTTELDTSTFCPRYNVLLEAEKHWLYRCPKCGRS